MSLAQVGCQTARSAHPLILRHLHGFFHGKNVACLVYRNAADRQMIRGD